MSDKPAQAQVIAIKDKQVVIAKDEDSLGFEYEFLPLLPTEEDKEIRMAPRDLHVSKVDARADLAVPDEALTASIRDNGLINAILATKVREKKTGKVVVLVVAGRRRRAGAEKAKLAEVPVRMRSVKNLAHYLLLAGKENIDREEMGFWDRACYFRKLLSTGMKQSDIATEFAQKTDGFISQHLAVFKLDPRVQKLVAEATHDPFRHTAATVVRDLKRIDEPDLQVKYAMDAIENGWSPKALKAKVDVWIHKQEQAGERKGKKGSRKAIKLPEAIQSKDVTVCAKALLVAGRNYHAARYTKLGASDKVSDTTLAYEKGRRDCLDIVLGLADPPAQWESSE